MKELPHESGPKSEAGDSPRMFASIIQMIVRPILMMTWTNESLNYVIAKFAIVSTATTQVSGCLLLRCEKSFKSTINIACRNVILDAEMCMYIYVKMVSVLSMWTCVQERNSALQIGIRWLSMTIH